MKSTLRLKVSIKVGTAKAMEKWYRDLFHACDKKRIDVVRELVTMEENQRRAGDWNWGAECFDAEFITEKDDLLHRAFLLVEAAKMGKQ